MPHWYVGLDLAWGERSRTGLAVLDSTGALVDLAVLTTDDEIVARLQPYSDDPCLVAVDAPIVVTNPTGRRACEAELGRQFGRYDAGAHPSNTGRPHLADGGRALRLVRRLGLVVDALPTARRRAIEVYPHPATVALFDLPRTLKYKHKPGRDLSLLRSELSRLVAHLEALEAADPPLFLRGHPGWHDVVAEVHGATRKAHLKRVEDAVDAVVCGYVGMYSLHRPERTEIFGDPADGFIVTPTTDEIRAGAR